MSFFRFLSNQSTSLPLSLSFIDKFNRRYHITTLRILPFEELHLWDEPELFPYGHDLYFQHFDYPFFFSVFNLLLSHEHTTV